MNSAHLSNKRRNERFSEPMDTSKMLLFGAVVSAIVYFLVLAFWFRIENILLFSILMFGQTFYLWQGFTYIYTAWDTNKRPSGDPAFAPDVDVYITVAGEPVDIVEKTVRAATAMDYPRFKVYILNDGYVAKKENWRDIQALAERYAPSCRCITRTEPGGAKAGNINHALRQTHAKFFVVFDADHVPHADFLRKTILYFSDPKVGWVQTPQYYKNYNANEVTRGAWEQQEIYYGAICKGKNRFNAVTMCGTNMVIRREAIEEVGGMCDFNIAEDFITGMFIHERGWKSVYVPEVLAEGLAPEDFLSYYNQQLRWARGSLEVFFKYNPLFRSGLSFNQRIMYVASAGYYLAGLIVFLNMLLPLVYFFFGVVPFAVSTMALAAAFMPYIFLMVYSLQQSTNYSFTFRALAFSMSSFGVHMQALTELILGKKTSFAITSKERIAGSFLHMVWPHILYVAVVTAGAIVAWNREGVSPSFATNVSWALLNISIFIPFIIATLPRPQTSPEPQKTVAHGARELKTAGLSTSFSRPNT